MLRRFLKVICWPILFGIGQLLFMTILTIIYIIREYSFLKKGNPTLSQTDILNQISFGQLSLFINQNMWLLIIGTILLLIPLSFFVKKKYVKHAESIPFFELFFAFTGAFCFSILWNVGFVRQTNISTYVFSLPFVYLLIQKGILGPILEEYLFRGLVYHKLQSFLTKKRAIICSILIFAFFHNNINQILFAFFLGVILMVLYERYHNLVLPILFHITVNVSSIVLSPYLDLIPFWEIIPLFCVTLLSLWIPVYCVKRS